MNHFFFGIKQTVIEIYVENLRTVLYLFAGYGKSLFVFLFFYQTQELTGTGNVATLTNIHKISSGQKTFAFKSRKPQIVVSLYGNMRCFERSVMSYDSFIFSYEFVSSSATTADNINKPFVNELLHLYSHFLRRLTVFAHFVWQSCIGIYRYIIRCERCERLKERFHFLCAKRAVQANRHYSRVVN